MAGLPALRRGAVPGGAGDSSSPAAPPTGKITVILPDLLSRLPRLLSVRGSQGVARPCGMNGACIGRFARRADANVSHSITPGHPILPHPLPHSPNRRLTPTTKTLQSPYVPLSGGSVQQGLSAANTGRGLNKLGGAADKRYSLGSTFKEIYDET